MRDFTTRSVYRNDAVAKALVALRTYAAIRNLDPLRLQEHEFPSELVVAALAGLANDVGVENGRPKSLEQERPYVLGGDKRRKKLQCFHCVQPWAVAADETQSRLK